jgi:hypothetical protein
MYERVPAVPVDAYKHDARVLVEKANALIRKLPVPKTDDHRIRLRFSRGWKQLTVFGEVAHDFHIGLARHDLRDDLA